jgi:hypothetical protein
MHHQATLRISRPPFLKYNYTWQGKGFVRICTTQLPKVMKEGNISKHGEQGTIADKVG